MSKSIVRNFFDKSENGATCKLCKSAIKTCGNTTNLRNHMNRKHSSVKIYSPSSSKTCRSTTHVMASTSTAHDNVDDPDVVLTDFSKLAANIVNKVR